jgi:hypothetical protein
VLICKWNRPIAELRAIEHPRTEPRPIGGDTRVIIHPSLFEPMPDEFLEAFEAGPIDPVPPARASRVAERPDGESDADRRGKRRT